MFITCSSKSELMLSTCSVWQKHMFAFLIHSSPFICFFFSWLFHEKTYTYTQQTANGRKANLHIFRSHFIFIAHSHKSINCEKVEKVFYCSFFAHPRILVFFFSLCSTTLNNSNIFCFFFLLPYKPTSQPAIRLFGHIHRVKLTHSIESNE